MQIATLIASVMAFIASAYTLVISYKQLKEWNDENEN